MIISLTSFDLIVTQFARRGQNLCEAYSSKSGKAGFNHDVLRLKVERVEK
jgi:hypothetical protein